jgi:hypothetical protein
MAKKKADRPTDPSGRNLEATVGSIIDCFSPFVMAHRRHGFGSTSTLEKSICSPCSECEHDEIEKTTV